MFVIVVAGLGFVFGFVVLSASHMDVHIESDVLHFDWLASAPLYMENMATFLFVR